MAHHIIYIPGIGDHLTYGQDSGIQIFRLFGFVPHYLPLGWAIDDGFDVKLNRLSAEIDRLTGAGHQVSVIGTSAGASAVLAAYTQRPQLTGVIAICGKIHNPQTVSEHVYARNPDFKTAMGRVAGNLRLLTEADLVKNIMSIHPLLDLSVPPADTKIIGAKELTLPGWGHMSGIFVGVIFGAPFVAKFLHSLEQR